MMGLEEETESWLHHFWHEVIATPGGITAVAMAFVAACGIVAAYIKMRGKRP